MVSSAATIVLAKKGNLLGGTGPGESGRATSTFSSSMIARSAAREPFLRIPPFPKARVRAFIEAPAAPVDASVLAGALRRLRVGGSYWAAQPHLPADHVLVRTAAATDAVQRSLPGHPIVVWEEAGGLTGPNGATAVVSGECDPWHMLAGAIALVGDADDEVSLIAALLGIPCYALDPVRNEVTPVSVAAAAMLGELAASAFEDPFTGASLDALQAAELCGFWRRLVDSNRDIAAGVGFAFWKQNHVAPLLWGGTNPLPFRRSADLLMQDQAIALWRVKAGRGLVAELERKGSRLIEVEDGFLRSRGLGADCIPPLSITVDRLGAHFDPARPSELELLLQDGEFDEALLDRARDLRRLIVEAGIGKYECGIEALDRPAGKRRHVLVPGQVEDDRAVQAGGCGLTSNLDLLERVREQAPDAYILYKPHPDVLAGHRRGAMPDASCLRYADEVVGELPIASLIGMVDEVHVNTSLAGFEALLRDKQVTTYGVPFYAGWGLTSDLGPVPARRTARRTIDELVAATLLQYPRYLDPVTGLPCPAEVIVARLNGGEERDAGVVVGMRRLQGKLMRRLRRLVQ